MYILKVYSIHYIHWYEESLKKYPSGKVNITKYALFFLSRAPTRYSFTFNLRLLYESKHKIHLSKTVYGIFHFRFRFVFMKVCIIVLQNARAFWKRQFFLVTLT